MAKGFTVSQNQVDKVHNKIKQMEGYKKIASTTEAASIESMVECMNIVLTMLDLPRYRK